MPRDLAFERAAGFAAELIRIPLPAGREGAVAARIVDELRAPGCDEVRTDRAGNVIGRIAGRGQAPSVMPSTHMDVVDDGRGVPSSFEAGLAGWPHHPGLAGRLPPWRGTLAGRPIGRRHEDGLAAGNQAAPEVQGE